MKDTLKNKKVAVLLCDGFEENEIQKTKNDRPHGDLCNQCKAKEKK